MLIATRGEIARRLLRYFRERGIETVIGFAEPEVELAYIEDADYPVYLNGRTVAETYANPRRVVSAALDAGCDAIHPGYCFLAERVDFYQMAATSNMPVIGCVPTVLPTVVSRMKLRDAAGGVGIALIPSSPVLPPADDGVAAAAQLGLPLFVKAVDADAFCRVDSVVQLGDALAHVRAAAVQQDAEGAVYLERVVAKMRQFNTTVVADHHGSCLSLGSSESTVQSQYRKWVEEIGTTLLSEETWERLNASSVALARAVGWVGVGVVRWAITDNGGVYLLGMSARLTTGYSLFEQAHGVDLIDTQLNTLLGEPLTWGRSHPDVSGHALQLRVLHLDPATGRRPEGTIDVLEVPRDVLVELGCEEGQQCSKDTDPLLLKLTVQAGDRSSAIAKALEALDEVSIRGLQPTLSCFAAFYYRMIFVRRTSRLRH